MTTNRHSNTDNGKPKFKVIYADPAWPYNTWNAVGVPTRKKIARGMAYAHYPVMSIQELKDLPVGDYADKDSVLLMWSVWPRLTEALEVGAAWGFRYVTNGFIWIKLTPKSRKIEDLATSLVNWSSLWISPTEVVRMLPKFHFGLGYWTRANSEPCLLFTRGKPKRINVDVAQLVIAPVGRHSQKPAEMYDHIERLLDGPYLELFARQKLDRANWSFWGNEIEPDIDMPIKPFNAPVDNQVDDLATEVAS